MQTLFGFDLSTGQKWIIAFAVILVLLALLGLFVRQLQGGRLRLKAPGGGRQRQPRLGVVEVQGLDRQRQLILIRRDNVEHLIMIGGASDVVVETNIMRGAPRASLSPLQSDSLMERPVALEAPAYETRIDPSPEARRTPVPSMAEPEPRAPSEPRAPAPPPRQAPSFETALAVTAAAGVAAAATPSVQAPNFSRDHAPSPAASAAELDTMSRQLEEAMKRPYSAVRATSAAANPLAEPISAAPEPAPQTMVVPDPVVAPAVTPPLTMTPPPLVTPPPARQSPPALDVAAELEMALGLRPDTLSPKPAPMTAQAARENVPPTSPSAEPPAVVSQASFEDRPDSVAAPAPEPVGELTFASEADDAPAATQDEIASENQAHEALEPVPALSEPSVRDENSAVEAEAVADPLPAAELPSDDEPASDAKPVSEAKPEPAAKPAEIDPFSVDAIEAEFARLLGRDPRKL